MILVFSWHRTGWLLFPALTGWGPDPPHASSHFITWQQGQCHTDNAVVIAIFHRFSDSSVREHRIKWTGVSDTWVLKLAMSLITLDIIGAAGPARFCCCLFILTNFDSVYMPQINTNIIFKEVSQGILLENKTNSSFLALSTLNTQIGMYVSRNCKDDRLTGSLAFMNLLLCLLGHLRGPAS